MPVIYLDIGAGQLDETQKKELITRLTSDAASISGIAETKYTVFIAEHPLENIGFGGKTMKEIRAGR